MAFGLFKGDKEEAVIELFKQHSRNSVHATRKLKKLVDLLEQNKLGELSAIASNVEKIEGECDSIKREINRGLTEGAFMPATREKFYALITQMDDVVGGVNDAAAIFLFLKGVKVERNLTTLLHKLVNETVRVVEVLDKAVGEELSGQECEKDAQRVDEMEHQCDLIKREIYRQILSKERSFNDGKVLTGLVDSISEVSDLAEDACDTILALKIVFKP